ncbi:MAG: hypothetical protein IJI14_05765 [Anaerolineaceae bacterium]|nr:hypothetical protein [Anaerolineaceae bacterium]
MADDPKSTGNNQDNTPNDGGNEKTFIQAELDKIVGERLAWERKTQPDPEKRKKFDEWKRLSKRKQRRRLRP